MQRLDELPDLRRRRNGGDRDVQGLHRLRQLPELRRERMGPMSENAEQRAQRGVDELVSSLCRLQNEGLLHSGFDAYRTAAENLVTWGWTRIGPSEKVVTPMSAEEAFETVRKAFEHWEQLKKERKGPAEVSSDESELTSGVKGPSPESLILAAFAGADRPLTRVEACDAAAGAPVPFFPDGPWHRWRDAFQNLLSQKLVERFFEPDRTDRYVITEAGRALYVQHELDGVEG